MFEYSEEYKIIPYSQIKPKNGNCDSGYKKCGKINKDGDFLCFEEELECPINDIIVKSTNSPPSDAEYSKYQIGDQFIFYTNQKTDNFMIKYFYINFDTDTNNDDSLIIIDIDSVSNLSKYNDIYFDEYRTKPKTAYLNYVQYFSNFTYEEMLKFQDIYVKKNEIYSKELIDEMNSNVKSHKYLLMAFGIVFLGYIVSICVFFFPIYGAACNCGKACAECCGLCQNITPIKRVSHFYLAFLPCFILMLVSFFITISKKKTYNKYLSMEFINDYKNYKYDPYDKDDITDYFQKSITYNNIQFINLLIIVILLVLYPLIILISTPRKRVTDKTITNNNKKMNNLNNDNNNNSNNALGPFIDSNPSEGYNSQNLNYNYPNQGAYYPPNNYQNNNYQGERPYYG